MSFGWKLADRVYGSEEQTSSQPNLQRDSSTVSTLSWFDNTDAGAKSSGHDATNAHKSH